MEIKKLIGIDMESRGGDMPEVEKSYDEVVSELKKLNLDKDTLKKIDYLISDYAVALEEQGYTVGFDSAVSLLADVKSKINSMDSGVNEI